LSSNRRDYRDGFQIVHHRGLTAHHLRGSRLIGQGNKRKKTARLVLQLAQFENVVQALINGFHMAVEQRGVGSQNPAREPYDEPPTISARRF
jgi:hypothetical protein